MPYCTHQWAHIHTQDHAFTYVCTHTDTLTNKQDTHKHCPSGDPPTEAAQGRAADSERERDATHHIRDQQDQKEGVRRELSRKDLQPPPLQNPKNTEAIRIPSPNKSACSLLETEGSENFTFFNSMKECQLLRLVFYISFPLLHTSHSVCSCLDAAQLGFKTVALWFLHLVYQKAFFSYLLFCLPLSQLYSLPVFTSYL